MASISPIIASSSGPIALWLVPRISVLEGAILVEVETKKFVGEVLKIGYKSMQNTFNKTSLSKMGERRGARTWWCRRMRNSGKHLVLYTQHFMHTHSHTQHLREGNR